MVDPISTTVVMFFVVGITCGFMLMADRISRLIGAGIVSRVIGLILASVAATNVLEGAKEYFQNP